MNNILYYESHITIDPMDQETRERIEIIVNKYSFKIAKLLMDKGMPSQLDTFITGYAQEFTDIQVFF